MNRIKKSIFDTYFFLPGQRTLHHKSDVLETVVLVNPSEDTVISEVSYLKKVSVGQGAVCF